MPDKYSNLKKTKKKNKDNTPLPNQAVSAYREGMDPLGSYTGNTEEMRCMPRRGSYGKVYMKVDETPTQDADDL